MSIKAKVKRLEEAVGIGQQCLDCRVHYIRFGAEIRRTAPEDTYQSTCHQCGQTLAVIQSGYSERDRKVLRLVADVQGDLAKWLAANFWMQHHPRFQEIKNIGDAEETRLRGLLRSENPVLRETARKKVKVLDEYKAAQESFVQKQQEVIEQGKDDGDDTYARPVAILEGMRERRGEIGDHRLYCYCVMAAMEEFIWGEKSAETLALLESRKRELAALNESR